MRFSRSNLTSSVNHQTQEGLHTDQVTYEQPLEAPVVETAPADAEVRRRSRHYNPDATAADAIEGRAELPVWQRAFLMGPNVRFTRTPHIVDAERRNPPEKHVEDHSQTVNGAPHAVSQDTPLSVEVQANIVAVTLPKPERPIAKPMYIPQPPGATGARALSYRLRRELALQEQQRVESQGQPASGVTAEPMIVAELKPEVVEVAAPQITAVDPEPALVAAHYEAVVQQASPEIAPAVEPAPLSNVAGYLPDHLFWELVDVAPEQGTFVETNTDGVIAPAVFAEQSAEDSRLIASDPVIIPVATPAAVLEQPVVNIVEDQSGPSPVNLYRAIGVRQPNQMFAQPSGAIAEVSPSVVPAFVEETSVPDHVEESAHVDVNAPEAHAVAPIRRIQARSHNPLFIDAPNFSAGEYELPPIDLLQQPPTQISSTMTPEMLEQSAGLLESILEDFGVKGEIIDVRPGPVVTLYEFEPAPGVKSSRVIGLSDDIARSMSALSARVAVVPGRNVIGIELPNPVRETVYFRELIESPDYDQTRMKLALCLGKTIGGEPVVAELAKMPHLLVAGTTGSGKSVAINTMILSLLYRLKPEECRLIMVDPKMLELSIYDGIPHLLTPVVTDPKKAVMALKWAVREMEDRYKKMSRLGVRNIDGYNARAASAREKGETVYSTVQTGFDRSTGEPIYEQEEMDLTAMPYIVVIVDEMADLMMVAGKEIEGAIQRLAQMARAAGIHLIMATQRPSVDVITGTIKANFPTRISFQVTSKIDSRTILGEQGAEHLLGQGDMLHMMGGGRISRVHGPFVSDEEVEKVVAHLKAQGRPEYLGTVTEEAEETEAEHAEDAAVFDKTAMGDDDTADLYEKAVKVVLRDKKCSTSYIQRRLSIGYNRAASLVERMEQDGIVGPANHVGKRSIIAGERSTSEVPQSFD